MESNDMERIPTEAIEPTQVSEPPPSAQEPENPELPKSYKQLRDEYRTLYERYQNTQKYFGISDSVIPPYIERSKFNAFVDEFSKKIETHENIIACHQVDIRIWNDRVPESIRDGSYEYRNAVNPLQAQIYNEQQRINEIRRQLQGFVLDRIPIDEQPLLEELTTSRKALFEAHKKLDTYKF
jgi:hypothetical protein